MFDMSHATMMGTSLHVMQLGDVVASSSSVASHTSWLIISKHDEGSTRSVSSVSTIRVAGTAITNSRETDTTSFVSHCLLKTFLNNNYIISDPLNKLYQVRVITFY